MAHAWKACWVQALGGSNPPSSATGPRDLLRFRGFCCLQPRLISGRRESCPPASRPRRVLLLVVLLVFRAPSGPAALMGRAALCARGRRPAREPSAPRASLGASSRSPARPRRRPPAPRPGPPGPPVPSTPATLVVLCAPAGNRAVTALPSPGLVPLDSEALDDLCARECGQDLARHKELRAAQARADAAPSDRARRVDEEPP